jgi:hypothetical protein
MTASTRRNLPCTGAFSFATAQSHPSSGEERAAQALPRSSTRSRSGTASDLPTVHTSASPSCSSSAPKASANQQETRLHLKPDFLVARSALVPQTPTPSSS